MLAFSRQDDPRIVEAGERITVTTTAGQKAEMVFVALTADVLEGTFGWVVKGVLVALVTLLAIGLCTVAFMP